MGKRKHRGDFLIFGCRWLRIVVPGLAGTAPGCGDSNGTFLPVAVGRVTELPFHSSPVGFVRLIALISSFAVFRII